MKIEKQHDQSFSVSVFTRQIFQKKPRTTGKTSNRENRLGQQFADSSSNTRRGVSIYTSASSGREPIGIFETRLSTRWHVPIAVDIYVHARAREYLINRRRHVNTSYDPRSISAAHAYQRSLLAVQTDRYVCAITKPWEMTFAIGA